jgi:putative ABC transport system substrate-binding protein
MDRRAFVTGLGAVLAAPLVAEAQKAEKVYRVGLIFTTSPVSVMAGPEPVHPSARAFMQGLRALGYVEGKNLILERRSAEGQFERFGDIAAELVRLRTDVIVAPGDVAPRAAKTVTTIVPIVMATAEDPVGAGLVQSLARPGGNVTGLMLVVGPEIEGKRLEIFREALPGVSRVATSAASRRRTGRAPGARAFRRPRRRSV